jgi:exopolysaccharide production protein ExoZ
MSTLAAGKQLLSIQYLRAIAALMVVMHHARQPRRWLFDPLDAYPSFAFGVDIFFVISGFVMYAAARNELPLEFLRRRVVRIVPLYWAATAALLLISNGFNLFALPLNELAHFAKSLLFIPHFSLSHPEQIWPYLIPGWALNYQMFFYLVFLAGLAIGRVQYTSSIILLLLVAVGALTGPVEPVAATYTGKLMLEFVIGTWIGVAWDKGLLKGLRPLLFLGFACLFLYPIVRDHVPQVWARILCSSLIVIGAVSSGAATGQFPLMKLLGDASYSIYLTHTMLLKPAGRIWKQVPVDGWLQLIGWAVFALVWCSAFGVLVHRYVETPLLKRLSTRRAPPSDSPPGSDTRTRFKGEAS